MLWFMGLQRVGTVTELNCNDRSAGKESACNAGRPEFDPWVRKIPQRRERLPTPIFWSGEFHGLYSPWGHKESDTTEQLSFHFKSLLLCPILCSPLHEYLASEICNWEKEYFNNFLR